MSFKGIIRYVLWLIFPQRCCCCNKIIYRDRYLCDECSYKIERVDKLCTVCGCDLKCCQCRRFAYRFRASVSPFDTGEYSMKAVGNLKFRNNLCIADFFSEEIVKQIEKYYDGIHFDAIFAVPMHNVKRRIKGYNQSEVIARKIGKRLNIKYCNSLVKYNKNNVQHKLKKEERFKNVQNTYKCKEVLNFKNVLLIDDIKTTGATLNECTKQLMYAGVQNVYCATALTNNYKKINKKVEKD